MNQGLEILCPHCGKPQPIAEVGESCGTCGGQLRTESGVLNLVGGTPKDEEKEFYDCAYRSIADSAKMLRIKELEPLWHRPDKPENELVLERVGDLLGCRILLIGNGASWKELALLDRNPEILVYSDLSPHASEAVIHHVELDDYKGHIDFAAIDAENLPFPDNSLDVVYGFAMVHHLPDIDRFLRGAFRVLKPNGRAVFLDDAYSPVWHGSKMTWLKPLMKYSHKTTGISPEDYRFSMSGGFRESDLGPRIERMGGVPFFERTSFFTYIFVRGVEKLMGNERAKALTSKTIMTVVRGTDRLINKIPGMRMNQIRIIWGFTKPE